MGEPSAVIERAEGELLECAVEASRADWVYSTYVNDDTEALSSRANARLMDRTVAYAKELARGSVDGAGPEVARKTRLLRVSLSLVAPSGPGDAERLAALVARMQGHYAKGKFPITGRPEPLNLEALSQILALSSRPAELEEAWTAWHRVGETMKGDFTQYVALANRGARELDFADTGAMWRSRYDMEADAFAAEIERLWGEVRPLYVSLHTYVRRRLRERYGDSIVPERGPIPVHLLGNMWGQTWDNLSSWIAPAGSEPGYDLTKILTARHTGPLDMVRYAEQFFVSLGLDPLPETFWQRSMFARPADREVVCHASAWDVDYVDDLRIKMCIEITAEDFQVVHHELGHNYYQRAYARQPFLFRESAHDGFHEAVGDTIALSITPEYLVKIGLLDALPSSEGDIGRLLRTALTSIAFLPFGLAVDRWRWKVFSGEIEPSRYTSSWWEMRERYQGVRPPGARTESTFDPGAKYHVPANVPYMRYFLAQILQYQFHRALARSIGAKGPLHQVSIYGHPEAGARLGQMLSMGASQEWPDALDAITGERSMSGRGILEYFQPLQKWLEEQNRGQPAGW
ncbi:MAG: M2 family metallopeptidase [Thermoplasmata archaeon]